jgi:hypothetical protein
MDAKNGPVFVPRSFVRCRQRHDQSAREKVQLSARTADTRSSMKSTLTRSGKKLPRNTNKDVLSQSRSSEGSSVPNSASQSCGTHSSTSFQGIQRPSPANASIDAKRTEVKIWQIGAHFPLFATLSGAPVHFVFDMDGMGPGMADAAEKASFVPVYHGGDRVYCPVPRTGNRITSLLCVAARGSFLQPSSSFPERHTITLETAVSGRAREVFSIT